MWRTLVLMMCAALLTACDAGAPATAPAAGEWSDIRAPARITDWPLPSLRPGTHSPGLSATDDGRLLLSWVNSQRGRRHVFQFSVYDLVHQRWRGEPLTVVIGNSLHVDAANPPRMSASPDGALWARWQQVTAADSPPVSMFSQSRDGGANWSEPQPVGILAGNLPPPLMQMPSPMAAEPLFPVWLDISRMEIRPLALAVDAQQAWLLWMEGVGDGMPALWLSRRSTDLQEEYERRELVRLSRASLHAAGSPDSAGDMSLAQFALSQGTGYLVWSEARSTGTTLRGVKIQPPM